MPLLKVNQIASYSGNTLTVGTTGDTVTLAAGASVSGFGFDGVVWTSNIVTSALTVSANVGYFVNTSSAAITVTLPASASNGDQLIFTDYNRTWGTNALTLNTNSLKFQGNTSPSPIYNTNGQTVQLVYADSIQGWIPISDDDVTNETPQTFNIDFLVVAGGGGCSGYIGGGGGAGGYRTSTQTVGAGTVITVTVGAGGAGTQNTSPPNSGSNSSISGSGLTTITSAGGGGGARQAEAGANGGSGGGGAGGSGGPRAGGTGNTPSVSPSQGNNGGIGGSTYDNAGGGGGAGVTGSNGSGTTPGNGGNGTASSITGSSVTYAGGGGGGGTTNGSSGGSGGGGAGSGGGPATQIPGVSGTANTGGGGGGGSDYGATATVQSSGGSGVVILSVPTSNYSGTSTGSPTITTSGSNTILKFTGSGSYTT